MKNIKSIIALTLGVSISAGMFYSCKDKEEALPADFVPQKISLGDLSLEYLEQTVTFDSVYFDVNNDTTKLNGTSSNANGGKTIQDCNGNSAIIQTSTFSDLTNYYVPTGMGPLTAYVDEYNGTVQLV